ncbi:FliM/FliN family flagellar motor switch protein [Paracoccaceae bacterium Fryx2]|nr:FliM/FliN family flagellar motor switch protein [Paracoccaceae bacterium Fryx2]
MTATSGQAVDQGVIRRKLALAQAALLSHGGADRQWPLALARTARAMMDLVLEVPKLDVKRRSLTELLDMPPDRALIAVLDGPCEGLGVLALSPPMLAGLIEMQTIGRLSSNQPQTRKPTRTDAAMVAGFIDAALEGLEEALAEEADLVWAGGFRYASFLEDPRPLGLLLEDGDFRVLRAEVALENGARTGEILLALPAIGRGRRPAYHHESHPDPSAALLFQTTLRAQVLAVDCVLDAVLQRLTLPLAAVMTLKPGDVLPLPLAALDRIGLEGLDGGSLAVGKLGQHRGMRAVRLAADSAATAPVGGQVLVARTTGDLRKTGTG